MQILDALILGVLQGVTEFLPISSSGHLILGEEFLNLNVGTLKSFDVLVHLGTLLAIFVYFRHDVWEMIKSFFGFISGKLSKNDPYLKLIAMIVVGTIPAVLVGLLAEEMIDDIFRNVRNVGMVMVIVGLLFLIGEKVYKVRGEAEKDVNWWKATLIGVAQAVALIPGISRSGSTIVTGLFLGVERSFAARFSFLLGIPAMIGAGILTALKSGESVKLSFEIMAVGFSASFVAGFLSVAFLMRFLKKNSLAVFAFYLIVIGTVAIFI